MNIIVVGVGKVGSEICEHLATEGHDVTAVDIEKRVLDELSDKLDIMTVWGNGAEMAKLRLAGAERADLVIAVTASDELNLLCCASSKALGTRHTAARVRNREYSETLSVMKDTLGLSLSINPELAAAKEISRMLRFPSATKIETFSRGRVELAEFTVSAGSPLCNKSLIELRGETKLNFLVCGVARGSEVFIPSGDFVLRAGDTVNVTVSDSDVTKFFKHAGIYRKGVRDIIIVGGGRIAYYLAKLLEETRIDVKIIEKNKERCEVLCRELKNATVINGDGSNPELLIEEGIDSVDGFVALTDIDEENAINSMYAASRGVHKTVTKINQMAYIDFYRKAGIESIISPKYITAAFIIRFVRAMCGSDGAEMERLYKIMDNRAEALEFYISERSELTDTPLKNLPLKKDVKLACIVRDDRVITPSGNDTIKVGDTVVIVTAGTGIHKLKDIIK